MDNPRVIASDSEAIPDTQVVYFSIGDCFVPRNDALRKAPANAGSFLFMLPRYPERGETFIHRYASYQ
jgi:hypothetical protein